MLEKNPLHAIIVSTVVLTGCTVVTPTIDPDHPADCVSTTQLNNGNMIVKNTCSKDVHAVGEEGELTIPARGSIKIPSQLVTNFSY